MHELEEVELEAIQRHIRILEKYTSQNLVILDVGANSGAVSEAYLDLSPQATIYAFEPNPDLLSSLTQRLGERIILSSIALGDENHDSDLNVFNDDTASSLFEVDPKLSEISDNFNLQRTISVKVQTLDSWIEHHPEISQINILKIDTQGYDLRVLQGAHELLKHKPPQLIQVEMTVATAYIGQADFSEIWSFLSQFGYRLYDFDRLVHTQEGNLYWGDVLFISLAAWEKIGLI